MITSNTNNMSENIKDTLAENAFRELKEGEEYVPLMPKETNPREVNAWSVCWGILMAVIFSAAAALKIIAMRMPQHTDQALTSRGLVSLGIKGMYSSPSFSSLKAFSANVSLMFSLIFFLLEVIASLRSYRGFRPSEVIRPLAFRSYR